MTEELKKTPGAFQIWKNPSKPSEPVVYLGRYRPPAGKPFFTQEDFRELGFGPGDYTVLVPEDSPLSSLASKWQKVSVPG